MGAPPRGRPLPFGRWPGGAADTRGPECTVSMSVARPSSGLEIHFVVGHPAHGPLGYVAHRQHEERAQTNEEGEAEGPFGPMKGAPWNRKCPRRYLVRTAES